MSFDPDADGLTPALNGLVLTERLRQATDTPEKLKSVDYRYAVTAAAPNGTKGEIGGYKPRTGETLVIVVKP